jgi:hypothetical protein
VTTYSNSYRTFDDPKRSSSYDIALNRNSNVGIKPKLNYERDNLGIKVVSQINETVSSNQTTPNQTPKGYNVYEIAKKAGSSSYDEEIVRENIRLQGEIKDFESKVFSINSELLSLKALNTEREREILAKQSLEFGANSQTEAAFRSQRMLKEEIDRLNFLIGTREREIDEIRLRTDTTRKSAIEREVRELTQRFLMEKEMQQNLLQRKEMEIAELRSKNLTYSKSIDTPNEYEIRNFKDTLRIQEEEIERLKKSSPPISSGLVTTGGTDLKFLENENQKLRETLREKELIIEKSKAMLSKKEIEANQHIQDNGKLMETVRRSKTKSGSNWCC